MGGRLMSRAIEEAWRCLDSTDVVYPEPPPELPPEDLDTCDTQRWLPRVTFVGIPLRFSADTELPANSQHRLAELMDEVSGDVTRDLTPADRKAGVANG